MPRHTITWHQRPPVTGWYLWQAVMGTDMAQMEAVWVSGGMIYWASGRTNPVEAARGLFYGPIRPDG